MDEDRNLIRRMLLGDPVAPDEFVYAWYYHIRQRIREQFRSLSENEVDDLVQGIFEKLAQNGWRRLAAWNGLEDDRAQGLDGYLYAIARNYTLDYLYQQSTRRRQRERYEQMRHDDRYEDHALPVSLKRFVDQLMARDRQIIALRFNEELSYREIAERMDMSVNHVGVQLGRALDRLHAIVQRNQPELLDRI